MNKDIYICDLINRYPGHTFTETVINDFTKVTFLDEELVEIASAKKMNVVDAYRSIRNHMLEGENLPFLVSTTDRDKFQDLMEATFIFNITNLRNESYHNKKWASSAGPGLMNPVAFGHMNEENESGTIVSDGWITGKLHASDANGIITFLDHAIADRLVIGIAGTGEYTVNFSSTFIQSGNVPVTATVFINGTKTNIKDSHKGDPILLSDLSHQDHVSLSAGDYLDLRFSTPNGEITIYHTELFIQRIT